MRSLDYICESSSHPEPVILSNISGPAGSPPPTCPTCSAPTEILWSLSYSHNPGQFRPVTLYADLGDGQGKRSITCTSLYQLRQVEGRTRSLWEQGLGDPVAIRQLSMDHSNQDVGIFDQYDSRPAPVARSGRGALSRYQVGCVGDKNTPPEVLRAIERGEVPVMHINFGD